MSLRPTCTLGLALLLAACSAQSPDDASAGASSDQAARPDAAADTASTDPSNAGTAAAPADAAPSPVDAVPSLPSFDCAAAQSDAERMVCDDPELAALDRRVAEVYAEARAAAGADDTSLAATQRGWVKGRDACWTADDRRRCVLESYKTQLVQLQLNSGKVEVPAAVAYLCDDPSRRFTAVFYDDLDPKAAVVTWGDDQAIVFPVPAASGARYGRDGLDFWERNGEASVDFYGNRLVCKAAGNTPA